MLRAEDARNFSGVQHENVRRRMELGFLELDDAISAAYYGRDFEYSNFTSRSVQLPGGAVVDFTPAGEAGSPWSDNIERKRLFGKLCAVIQHLRMLAFHQTVLGMQPEENPPERDDYDGQVYAGDVPVGRKTEIAASELALLRTDLQDNYGIAFGNIAIKPLPQE